MSDTDLLFWGVPKTKPPETAPQGLSSAAAISHTAILDAMKYEAVPLKIETCDVKEAPQEVAIGSIYQVLISDLNSIPIEKDGVIEIIDQSRGNRKYICKIISGARESGISLTDGQWWIFNQFLINTKYTKLLYTPPSEPTIAPFPVEDVKIGW